LSRYAFNADRFRFHAEREAVPLLGKNGISDLSNNWEASGCERQRQFTSPSAV